MTYSQGALELIGDTWVPEQKLVGAVATMDAEKPDLLTIRSEVKWTPMNL